MTHPTQDADKMKALELFDECQIDDDMWQFNEHEANIIRACLTTPAPQSEKVEVVTENKLSETIYNIREMYDKETCGDFDDFAARCLTKTYKITKEPNNEQ